jgi:protein-disulfide isomerase
VLEKHATDAKVAFHHYPLDNECNASLPQQVHPASCLASYAAECAGEQGKFWEFADQLFMNQRKVYSRPDLEGYATTVGLNVGDFNTCMNEGRTKQFVRNDIEEAHRIGVNSTPTMVINGRVLPGAPTPEQFSAIIEYEKQQVATKKE